MSTRRAGIEEPVQPTLRRVLRRAVADHAADERRRVFPVVLHCGFPGSAHRTLTVDPSWRLDEALRVDVVEAIARDHLAAGKVPLLWLTRSDGEDPTTSDDLAWAAAVRAAGAELGVVLDLVVVTRTSWHDPRTGVGRRWRRMREPARTAAG